LYYAAFALREGARSRTTKFRLAHEIAYVLTGGDGERRQ